jgi:hypothetical protein
MRIQSNILSIVNPIQAKFEAACDDQIEDELSGRVCSHIYRTGGSFIELDVKRLIVEEIENASNE